MTPRPMPPDVASATEALCDELRLTNIGVDEAIQFVCDEWNIKEHVLRIKFEQRYGLDPELFANDLRSSQNNFKQRITHTPISQIATNYNHNINGIYARRQPIPSDFGLKEGFSVENYRGLTYSINKKLTYHSIFIYASLFIIIGSLFRFSPVYFLLIFHPYGIVISISSILFLNKINKYFIMQGTSPQSKILGLAKQVSNYENALREWQQTQTELGSIYWQNLRGLDFEKAVKQLLARRGCNATLTQTTRDGGVDIVVTGTDRTYWCQCKGHAKKISVSEVRQIKGVCSNSIALPVLISPNGFTEPARDEASRIGVILIDSEGLCRLANQTHIYSLGRT